MPFSTLCLTFNIGVMTNVFRVRLMHADAADYVGHISDHFHIISCGSVTIKTSTNTCA